jgi:hypothetical protein
VFSPTKSDENKCHKGDSDWEKGRLLSVSGSARNLAVLGK